MTDPPPPPPVNSPFGAPGSGWSGASGASGPFGSSSGGGGRRKLVVVVLVAALVAAGALVLSVFLRDDSSSDTADSDQVANESATVPEPDATVPPPGATPAPTTADESSTPSTEGGQPEPEPSAESTTLPDEVDPTPETLFEGDRVSLVVDEITAARGGEQLRVLKMVIYPEYLIGDVQDPAAPENVDGYLWRGALGDPEPVRLVGVDDLEAALFSADEMNWSVIAPVVAGAAEAVQIPDGEVTHVIVERPLPFSTDVRVRVFVTGARENGFVDADADGVVIAIDGQAVGDD